MTTNENDIARSPLRTVRAPNDGADDGGFMSHAPRPVKLRNVDPSHPVVKHAPSTGVEAIMRGDENAPFSDGRTRRTWNENRAAQHQGANLFNARVAPATVRASGNTNRDGKLANVAARFETIHPKTLTLQELRQACRARGVNPGGSKDALVERLEEAIARKECAPLTLDSRPTTQRGAVGAGARFASKAAEVVAPAAVNRELRESQKIWRAQQGGHDIFGTKFVDEQPKKRKMVEGPKTTFSFEAVSDAFEPSKEVAPKDESVIAPATEEVAPKRAKVAAPLEAPYAEHEPPAAVTAEGPTAEHRKSAWSSFHGAGLFSESWTTASAEEEAADASLVKSATTATGAWASLDDEHEPAEASEFDHDDEDEDDEEARALREADEAVAAAERELAEELARESAGSDSE
ncbi:SAP domain [Ostreococcus tauri]|uniref:SAP domain n=1 Tax=Ostreococcus tauri TaxID=70448 RepID=Q016D5_OSTTA|nr:SAP domain [Ostreococcus tauri]CAL53726.1 SAP domain [Ostreococcus tauri]|eukprot:XP_003080078.1 SAP domain [Ostreococcus tauri]